METVDGIVVGAGVVGLAVARRLAMAGLEILLVERETVIGSQTSSRNSEVIHAGIYYPTGSLKATLCVEGRHRLYAYCRERGVAHARRGKLIVATEAAELDVLRRYHEQARRNGVDDLEWYDAARVRAVEPAVRAVAALWSPSTGVVDSHELMHALQGDFENAGGLLATRAQCEGGVLGRERHVLRVLQDGVASEFQARFVVNAAGLDAQQVAQGLAGLDLRCVPARHLAKGHYFTLRGRAPFQHLVYPVASSAGLGIHVTLDLAGGVRFGPDVEWIETLDYAFDDTRLGAFAAAIRRYWPDLDATRLQPGYTGIRPKIAAPGAPAADFLIQGPGSHGWPGLVNLFGIESPGLTAALAIAERVAAALGVVDGHRA